ncbi:MAG TPA: hypothetical protein VFA45_07830 [Actinomycetes bacterium]|nr:hypothetical protein [Actinomycetes bacterium]
MQALHQLAQPPGGQGAQVALVDRERRKQLADDGGIWGRWGRVAVELGQYRLACGEVAAKLADALHDRRSRLRDGLLVLKGEDLPAQPCLQVGDLALQLGGAGAGRRGMVGRVGGAERALPVAGALGAVDGGGQEAGHALKQGCLGDVDAGGVASAERAAAEPGGLALVVPERLLARQPRMRSPQAQRTMPWNRYCAGLGSGRAGVLVRRERALLAAMASTWWNSSVVTIAGWAGSVDQVHWLGSLARPRRVLLARRL